MKKWIALVLLASLVLTLSACGVDDIKIPTPVRPQPEESQAVETLTPTVQKSPYEEALEQGWEWPQIENLMEVIWHSELGYEIKLYYEPGQMYDGYVCVYEFDGVSEYVGTYSGNWLYLNGILTLVLEPYDETASEIRGDFPVLLAPTGEESVRIFATETGVEFPWFAGKGYDEWTLMHYYSEDPYLYALSQGWREPELWELINTGWLSNGTYFLDLLEDSVPSDNGGDAIIYDVDEYGAYTQSYHGTWQYENGYLHLCLIPEFDNGIFVDDSFPVLMLDGMLWIGRNEYGFGLPHFYNDQLIDVLEQPKG